MFWLKGILNPGEGKYQRDNCLRLAKGSDVLEQKKYSLFLKQEATRSNWIRTWPNKD